MPHPRRTRPVRRLAAAAALATLLGHAAVARADEPFLLTLEADAAIPRTAPQSDLFQPGVSGALGLYRPLTPWLAPGVRVRGVLLFDGAPPEDEGRVDPGVGGIGLLSLAARFRVPPGGADDPRRGTGFFVEVGGGVALTGDLVRGAAEGGVGWGFEVGAVSLAPTLRYLWLHEPNGQGLDDRDAHVLLAGVELMLFDRRPEPPPEPVVTDTDLDGIPDEDDACPTVPEDLDGFEDADGCPDPDNDGDSILDDDDACPVDPEDYDGFEDDDGCPDPDNDGDGFLDEDDECPDEAEVVNGVDDQDGCPDEGLIELVDDRIVLEERVLFDFERSRVKWRAKPVIQAIIDLYQQHPEWDEIQIEGHADVRGEQAFNQDLSERRARNVMEALVRAGLPEDVITSVGFGARRPRDLGVSEEAHQRNRRVEFVVLSRHDDPPPEAEEPVAETRSEDEGTAPDGAAAGHADDTEEGDAGDGETPVDAEPTDATPDAGDRLAGRHDDLEGEAP